MTNAYVSVGEDFNDVLAISSVNTVDTTVQVVLDEDTVDFSKMHGYYVYATDDGQNHLKFDQEKYDNYYKKLKEQEEEAKKIQQAEQAKQDLLNMAHVEYEESDKEGFVFKILKLGDIIVGKEYIEKENATIPDGEYLNPIKYKVGMNVDKGLFYTDETNIWECIKEGMPKSFEDKEYFDIIED